VLAGGYLFTAFIAVAHMLTFPGLFAPGGLLGAGPQSTAWLYMFWHGVFPLLVAAYAIRKHDNGTALAASTRPGAAILATIGLALAAVFGFTILATGGADALPSIMQGNRYTPAMVVVVSSVWLLSVAALAVLWRSRPHSVLDLWLMVVMCVWIFDIALSAVFNAGRFDVGFYAGRIYGLLAASFVLAVLLLENGMLYARLVEAHERERAERRLLEERTDELTTVNRELDMFSFTVAHDLRAPVRAVDGFARILEEDYGEQLDSEGRRLLSVVRESCQRMGQLIEDLLAYAHLGRQPLRTRQVQLDDLVNQTMAELSYGRDARPVEFAIGRLGTVEADPALLKQALANLLGNALKFTRDRNPAVVEVGCRADARDEDPSVYYVKDNGAGFDMRQYDKLFGVFQRLHRATSSRAPAWASPSCSGSSPVTAGGCGPNPRPARAPRSTSRSRGPGPGDVEGGRVGEVRLGRCGGTEGLSIGSKEGARSPAYYSVNACFSAPSSSASIVSAPPARDSARA
jgi:signal transduction histidine kinase